MEAFRIANNAAAKKKKNGFNNVNSSLQADLGEITSAQKSLEKSLSNLTVDLVKRFDDMVQLQNNLNSVLSTDVHSTAASASSSSNNRTNTPSPIGAHSLERSISRSRIAEEIQKRTQLKKTLSGNGNPNPSM